ncbi:phenylacetic acid degradation protein PaaN [Pseudorhodoplanes sp.]|uniref:phenylacetic acid degradation protein PaaN n=1 Tax=Pseudorhodoplanes sp. TaxID=1934341 RepID=UPI002B808D08|nr:phenylacetic acid degradation protein PaaN [Pseudorhodoplanes sp.]HWV51099.1 phenylacetic acid degradation protein PaaN [Pseudorhodoplanes sp.]
MSFFEAHRARLEQAVEACRTRIYWSAYPEIASGKIYGETAKADGEAAFKAMLGKPFDLGQSATRQVGREISPYGIALGITYPASDPDALIDASMKAGDAWARASIQDRIGVCLEIVDRINRQSFLIANAAMHTTGQAFMMAFQAAGPHAQDRALEAIAYAYDEMTRVPQAVNWTKPQGKGEPIVLDKVFRIVPRGVSLVIGCATFPTWNGYPAIFASLATGNSVIVKPHPGAILPLAITVRIGRDVLKEAGFDPNVLMLAADEADAPVTQDLAAHPGIAIVDFTGSPAFGQWVRENAATDLVFTEEAGINSIVIDSTSDFRGMCSNIGFSLSLYSGQMCTAPQNIFVPAGGIETNDGHKSYDDVAAGIATAIDKLLGDPDRAANILGTVQNEATTKRVQSARKLGRIVRDSAPVPIAGFETARTASPLLLAVDAKDDRMWGEERFGPIAFVIRTESTEEAITLASQSARRKGAITASLYSTQDAVIDKAADAFARAGVALSVNLTGGIYVNQSAAFSDYHVSGANPAGNACLTDSAFVANRFRVAPMRRQKAA